MNYGETMEMDKIKTAFKKMKNGKAPVYDKLNSEMIKYAGQEGINKNIGNKKNSQKIGR